MNECKPLMAGDSLASVPSFSGRSGGEAVQVESMKSTLKAPGTKRSKANYDVLLSSFAFNFNVRRYTAVVWATHRRARERA